MAAPINPNPRPYKSEKPWREALMLALNRYAEKGKGKEGKRYLTVIAEKCVHLAAEGDVSAMKEIADRMDGRATQQIQHAGSEGEALPTGLAVVFVKADK